MRNLLKMAATAVLGVALTTSAHAQDWTPPGPIKLMIAFAAGGGAARAAAAAAWGVWAHRCARGGGGARGGGVLLSF